MKNGKKLYEGKAKIIYATNDKNLVIQYFKDDATAFNNQQKSTIEGKGVLNNRISEHILSNLSQIGIKNHLVKRLNMREQIIKLVEIIPIEFIVRNVATGSITKRLGIEDGTVLKESLYFIEMPDKKTFVKSDIVKELQGHFQAIPNNDVERIVDSIFKYLGNALDEGRNIEIRGLGTFKVKKMPARNARNPKTGEAIRIEEKNKLRWKSSKLLNYRINRKEEPLEE